MNYKVNFDDNVGMDVGGGAQADVETSRSTTWVASTSLLTLSFLRLLWIIINTDIFKISTIKKAKINIAIINSKNMMTTIIKMDVQGTCVRSDMCGSLVSLTIVSHIHRHQHQKSIKKREQCILIGITDQHFIYWHKCSKFQKVACGSHE